MFKGVIDEEQQILGVHAIISIVHNKKLFTPPPYPTLAFETKR